LDIEILEETFRVYLECNEKQTETAKRLGIARSTLQNRLRRIAEKGWLGTEPVLEGFRISQSTAVYGEDGSLRAEFIQQKPEHGEVFKVPDGHKIKGISALVDQDGKEIIKWIKTDSKELAIENLADYFKTAFAELEGISVSLEPSYVSDETLLTVYPLPDLHHGLLAWGKESGTDWDISIGREVIQNTLAQLISQSRNSKTAIILNLGDYFHADDHKNMTPRSGNILDVDSRYMKMITTGVDLMVSIIEMALTKHENIIVRNLPGNHDLTACVALTVALSAYYAKNKRVTIDIDPSEFFFYHFGTTLIAGNHGHRLKPVDMAIKMACDRPKEWGNSKYRYFYFGHIHHETVKEVGNVRCESFQTVVAKDAHAANGGYMSGRSMTAITIHEMRGEIGRHKVNL